MIFMISIIITTFNISNYIHICLNSLIKQSYSDFEVICIDDGSTDKTYAIMEQMTASYQGPHKIVLNLGTT